MSYIVTVCDECQSVTLTATPAFGAEVADCESCSLPLRVLPSRMFSESERSLFRDLSEALGPAGLSSTQAHALIRRVTRAMVERSYLQCWEVLSDRAPGLFARHVVLGSNGQAHQRALVLVRTILEALATTRRSGVMPVVKLPAPHRFQAG